MGLVARPGDTALIIASRDGNAALVGFGRGGCLAVIEDKNWAVIALGGIPNKVQVGDMGIDGRLYPVGTKPTDASAKGQKGATDSMFADDWFPIQVKQSDKVGRPDIDAFEAVMEREGEGGRQRGFFVSFGYTRDAEQECAAFHKVDGEDHQAAHRSGDSGRRARAEDVTPVPCAARAGNDERHQLEQGQ